MEHYLHIVSFNTPWPANYGGIIDVYYKIKALHSIGVKIILHCFEYERPRAKALETVCEKVYYYPRKTGLISNFTWLPYNVYSRRDPELIHNLLKDDHPILFEGLHCCYYLQDPRLKERIKIYRAANIEHDYYLHLARAERNIIRKIFFTIEAIRFRLYQPVVAAANQILAVSESDTAYLKAQFPMKKVDFMPCFHANDVLQIKPGQSDFILYHAKLSVVENSTAALYLIQKVFPHIKNRCIIAGMNPPESLYRAAAPYPNIVIEANPTEERMQYLIHEAQIHLLVTFQPTGLKLKLLNSLFAGRHIVTNRLMTVGSGLESLCHIADTAEEQINICQKLLKDPIDQTIIKKRESLLYPTFSNLEQAKRLCQMIFNQ